jgi:hypothetical protein
MAMRSVKLISEKFLEKGLHMNWRYIMMVKAMHTSREVGHDLTKIMICTKYGS